MFCNSYTFPLALNVFDTLIGLFVCSSYWCDQCDSLLVVCDSDTRAGTSGTFGPNREWPTAGIGAQDEQLP